MHVTGLGAYLPVLIASIEPVLLVANQRIHKQSSMSNVIHKYWCTNEILYALDCDLNFDDVAGSCQQILEVRTFDRAF